MAAAEASLNGTLDGQDFEALLIEVQSEPAHIGRLASDLLKTTSAEPDWIIPRVAAQGWMVKVAGREKVGKGKLIFTTLGALERGEATVFGPATKPISSVIFTEEPEDSVREKVAQAGLDRALIVYGWELAGMDWHSKVDALANAADGYGLLFVDNISRAAAIEDEAGVELARAAEYLGDKSRQVGLTTLIDHHHRKGAGRLDDKSRGGTALAGACDNNLEIERRGDWESRVRRISSRGRMTATIWTMTVALSEDCRRYEVVADADEPQSVEDRKRLERLRELGDAGATAPQFAQIIEKSEDTARRALDEFVAKQWARVERKRPARYFATDSDALEL